MNFKFTTKPDAVTGRLELFVMSIYTYVVDHGKDTPAIGASTVVNGGKLQAVMFDDALAKLEAMEEFLAELRDNTTDDQTKYSIDDFLN